MSALLRVSALHTAYGASQVLFGIDLQIHAGESVTLLGRNGMGKTTTIRSIVGLTPPQQGEISFDDVRIDHSSPEVIARRGIALVPEGRQIFPNLTVKENLIAFATARANGGEQWNLQRVLALFPVLRERAANMGNQLSGGEQQMLAIGRALMTNPRLLILDEATEGLAPLAREQIWACLRTLKNEGLALLVVDKYVHKLLELADRHTLIERGRVVWQGDSAQLRADPGLWQRYLGV